MLTWCEQQDILNDHSFRNLKLSDYGYPGRPWKLFPRKDLEQIFSQALVDAGTGRFNQV